MTTPLTLATARSSDGKLVLAAEGEIDMSNIDEFNLALAGAATEAGDGALLVDLSAVQYLDSAAINTLAAHADRIELVAHPILMPVLRVSGLTELTTVEAAPPTAGQ